MAHGLRHHACPIDVALPKLWYKPPLCPRHAPPELWYKPPSTAPLICPSHELPQAIGKPVVVAYHGRRDGSPSVLCIPHTTFHSLLGTPYGCTLSSTGQHYQH